MQKMAWLGAAAVVLLGIGLGSCGIVVATVAGGGGMASATAGGGSQGSALSGAAPSGGPAVPATWEALDQGAAAAECPGMGWAVLAISSVASGVSI